MATDHCWIGAMLFLVVLSGCHSDKPYPRCAENINGKMPCLINEISVFLELPQCLPKDLATLEKEVKRIQFDNSTNGYYADLKNSNGDFQIELSSKNNCINEIRISFGGDFGMSDSVTQRNLHILRNVLSRYPGYYLQVDSSRVQIGGLIYEVIEENLSEMRTARRRDGLVDIGNKMVRFNIKELR